MKRVKMNIDKDDVIIKDPPVENEPDHVLLLTDGINTETYEYALLKLMKAYNNWRVRTSRYCQLLPTSPENLDKLRTVVVVLNSPGGFLNTGFAIYDLLMSLKEKGMKIITCGIGTVGSAATVIYMAGEKRYISESCVFNIHEPTSSTGSEKYSESKRSLELLQKDWNKVQNIYIKGTGTKNWIGFLKNYDIDKDEIYLRSKDCITYRFSTNIGIPFEIF